MKYIGNGSFLPDIPARDLSDDEVKLYGRKFLLESGLYIEEIKVKAKEKHNGSNTINSNTDWA